MLNFAVHFDGIYLGERDGRAPAYAALGTVRGVDGSDLLVEVIRPGGASALATLPAIHHVIYAEGDRVLVLFQGAEPASGVVAGRIDELADAVDPSQFVRADGSTPLAAAWDVGAAGRIESAEVRARDGDGLLLADAAGALGVQVANGGLVGIGTATPLGALHVWDGVGGHLHLSRTGVGATAVALLPAGNVTGLVRADALISNGTVRVYSGMTLTLGGAATQNVVTGSDTWQFRVNVDGSMDVRRTAGSGTAAVAARIMWL